MQKFIIIILQSEIRCNNWDVSTVKNITNVSSYPIYTFKMAEEYRSFPPLFVLHSEKLWTVDVSNDTRRFEADIEASSLSATWPRIEKTYNIFWMVSENRDICIPRDTIPGMFSHRARQPTSHPEICMYCIASFVSLFIFFNSVTNDQEAGEEEEGTPLSVYFLKRRSFIVRYVDAIFYRQCFDSSLDRVNANYLHGIFYILEDERNCIKKSSVS